MSTLTRLPPGDLSHRAGLPGGGQDILELILEGIGAKGVAAASAALRGLVAFRAAIRVATVDAARAVDLGLARSPPRIPRGPVNGLVGHARDNLVEVEVLVVGQ